MGYTDVLRVSTDPETVFGVDQVESWRDQPVLEGSYQPRWPHNHLPDMTAVARLHARNAPKLGSKFGAGFAAQYYLAGLSAGLGSAVAYSAPQTSFLQILRAAYGGVVGNSGSTVLGGGATVNTIPVQVGHGVRFQNGVAVMIGGVPATVLVVAGDSLTLDRDLPSAPANNTPVYNSVTVYPDEDGVGGDGNSLACRVLGYDASDQTIYRGCVPLLTAIRTEIDNLIVADVDMMAASWAQTTGETLAAPTIVDGGALPPVAGRIWLHAIGSSSPVGLECHRFAFTPGLALQATRNFGSATVPSVETVARFRQHRQDCRLELGLRVHARDDWDAWRDIYSSKPTLPIMLAFGNSPIAGGAGTGAVVISMPAAVFAAPPQRVEEDNEVGINLSFMAREDYATANLGDLPQAHQRIHLF